VLLVGAVEEYDLVLGSAYEWRLLGVEGWKGRLTLKDLLG
jgi:hypothetical protein